MKITEDNITTDIDKFFIKTCEKVILDLKLALHDYGIKPTDEEILIFLSDVIKRQENGGE